MNRLISVVIPVYNAEEYIGKCLDSVLAQTYTDFEIVVVNDCTPDASMQIVAQYAAKDSRVRVVENPQNMGTMKTRERGYQEARGEFVLFQDSDDTMQPYSIECLLQKQRETDADLVAGTLIFHKREGGTIENRAALPYGNTPEATIKSILKYQFPIGICAKLIRRSLLMDNDYQNFPHMTISEDACFLFQLVSKAKKIACVDKVIVDNRDNPTSVTHKTYTLAQIGNILQAWSVIVKVCEHYPDIAADLDRSVTFTVLRLYCYPFPKATLQKLIAQYGLSRYGSWCHGWKVLTLRQFVGTFISAIIKRQA